MKFVAALTVVLWLSLFDRACGYFLIEIAGNKPQEAQMAEETGSCRSGKQAGLPEMKGGLYTCFNSVQGKNQQKVIKCKKLKYWEKLHVRYVTNFFVVGNAQLNEGQVLDLDGLILTQPPEVMVVGFNPKKVDSPGLKPHPRCAEAGDVVSSMIFTNYLPDDENQVNALTEFFCCADVGCFTKDREQQQRAQNVYLPVVRFMLNRCISSHEATKKSARLVRASSTKSLRATLASPIASLKSKRWSRKSKSQSFAGSPASEVGTAKDPEAAKANLERAQLEAVMKVMMNTLIDPCILKSYVRSDDDLAELDYSCQVYCQFLGKAAEVFGRFVAVECNYLIDGSCSETVCFCKQGKTNASIKMLQCDNSLRKSLTPISQCQ